MKFLNTNKESEYHLYDDDMLVGKGYIYESEANKFYNIQRMNYFIEYDLIKTDDKKYAVELINNLVQVAESMRRKHMSFEARVYHCCFSENKEMIELCKTIDGFIADEGMHVLSFDIKKAKQDYIIDDKYLVVENNLATNDQVNNLIKQHSKSFRPGAYIPEDFIELKSKKGFKCISIKKEEELVANLLMFVNEDGIGFMEDLFVNESERGNGLGKYLVNYAGDYMKNRGIKHIELEVWSSNVKAYRLYELMGYIFKQETEVSIGKQI